MLGTARYHLRCALGGDLGPLGRPLDRSRSRATLLLVLGLLTALLLGSLLTARGVAGAAARAAARTAQLHRIEAVVTGPARPDATSAGFRFNGGDGVIVTWTYPAGHTASGRLDLPHSAGQGSLLPIWVTDQGALADPPPSGLGLSLLAVGMGSGVWLLATATVLAGYGLRRRALERRSRRQWASGWAAVEPHWSGRLDGHPGNTSP
ncbi:hypothetical protein GCM10010442_57530 [Kitasatospora kifunensis]